MLVDLNKLNDCYQVGVTMLVNRILLLDKWVTENINSDNPLTKVANQAQMQELISTIHIFKNLTQCVAEAYDVQGYSECMDVVLKYETL